jgi:tRNA A37 threonylcarbamoyladenosine dehydratase
MFDFLERTELLLGKESLDRLAQKHVMVVGLGGVGSYAAEAIARAGIGKMTIIDGDEVDRSNINRQLPATHSSIGQKKSNWMKNRMLDINPAIQLVEISQFLNPEDFEEILSQPIDFVMDCIDSVTPKINLITLCKKKKINIISSMGAGGKTDPKFVKIDDLSNTKECFFSQDVKKRMKKAGYRYSIRVVYSDEPVSKSKMALSSDNRYKKSYYGTVSYMPAIFGLFMSSYVIRRLAHDV